MWFGGTSARVYDQRKMETWRLPVPNGKDGEERVRESGIRGKPWVERGDKKVSWETFLLFCLFVWLVLFFLFCFLLAFSSLSLTISMLQIRSTVVSWVFHQKTPSVMAVVVVVVVVIVVVVVSLLTELMMAAMIMMMVMVMMAVVLSVGNGEIER